MADKHRLPLYHRLTPPATRPAIRRLWPHNFLSVLIALFLTAFCFVFFGRIRRWLFAPLNPGAGKFVNWDGWDRLDRMFVLYVFMLKQAFDTEINKAPAVNLIRLQDSKSKVLNRVTTILLAIPRIRMSSRYLYVRVFH